MSESKAPLFPPVTVALSPAIDGDEGLEISIEYAAYLDDPDFRLVEPGTLVDMAELQKHTKSGVRVSIHKEDAVNIWLLITQDAALQYAGELVKSVVSASPERLDEAGEMVMSALKEALEESRGRPEPPIQSTGPGSVSGP